MIRLTNFYSTQTRYSYLLMMLIGIFFLSPFASYSFPAEIVLSACFLNSNLLVIYSLKLPRHYIALLRLSAALAFIADNIALIPPLVQNNSFEIISRMSYCLFMILAILAIGSRIFKEDKVDIHIINGGICLFLILGILWYALYSMVLFFDPTAFGELSGNRTQHQLFYFSFTTLTTLGYGDITPQHDIAMTLTNAEAIIGMLYPAIFIARLVGLYSTEASQSDR